MRQLPFVISLIGILIMTNTVSAKTLPINLPELLSRSDIVVYGTVVSVQETKSVDSRHGRVNIVKLSPKIILKSDTGAAVLVEVPICGYPDYSESLTLSKDQQVLVFGVRRSECFEPILGYRGVCKINGDKIHTGAIKHEADWQNLDAFIERIKKMLKE